MATNLAFASALVRQRFGRVGEITIPVHGGHSVIARLQSTDLNVFKQVFIERQYEFETEAPTRIIDLGANTGYSSVFFLTAYPGSSVVAVEAEGENATLARRNLEPFGDRAKVMQQGVWPRTCGLVIEQGSIGGEWNWVVREQQDNEVADIDAITIDDLLDEMHWERVDLLKMDIEGSEDAIFSAHDTSWLAQIGMLVVELHTVEGEGLLRAAVAPYDPVAFNQSELYCFTFPAVAS